MNASNLMSSQATRLRWTPARLALAVSAALLAWLAWAPLVQATPADARLTVTVVDAQGQLMEHAVASLHSGVSLKAKPDTFAIMDQHNLQFAPTVLAIQAGTLVEFPNQDDVRHHVYSFSHPNAFELKLYHGRSGNFNQFDHPGVVVLGCNIHDGMLGYLRVVDTPMFASSDDTGQLAIEAVPSGDYQMQLWHPDLGMRVMRQSVSLVGGENTLSVTLDETGRAVPEKKPVHSLQSLFRD